MMNPSTKEFEPIEDPADARPGWPTFTVGAHVEVNGVVFAIRKITKRDLVIRPVK